MEFLEGDDLRSLLTSAANFRWKQSGSIIEQTLSGLSVAHQQGIIHRDLKPGNIMLEADGRVVVMDFGLARSMGGDGMTRSGLMVGTMEYMSPAGAGAGAGCPLRRVTVGLICTNWLPARTKCRLSSRLRQAAIAAIARARDSGSANQFVPDGPTVNTSERDPSSPRLRLLGRHVPWGRP